MNQGQVIIGEIESQGDIAVVSFKKSIVSSVDDIVATSAQLNAYVKKNQPKRIVFDFEGVKFFSSQVLGLILEMRAKLRDYGGEVAISSINPQLHRVFKITNLDQVFKFFENKESAIKAAFAD